MVKYCRFKPLIEESPSICHLDLMASSQALDKVSDMFLHSYDKCNRLRSASPGVILGNLYLQS